MWARLAKGVLGTDNVDAQLGDGLPAEVVLGLPGAPSPTSTTAGPSCLVAPDLREELPGPSPASAPGRGRPRRAGDRDRPTGDRAHRATSPRCCATRPARPARWPSSSPARSPATAPRRGAVRSRRRSARSTVATATSWSCSAVSRWPSRPTSVVQAAAALAALPDVKFLSRAAARQRARRARPRAHARLPARAGSRSTPPATTSPTRGASVPAQPGLDTAGVLAAAAAGTHRHARAARCRPRGGLPRPHPHARRARRGEVRRSRSARSPPTPSARADVFLPTSVWGEKAGSTTNLEGRVHAPGAARHARGHDDGRLAHRRRSSRRASVPTSGSTPSRTCRTRSPASRRRTPGSTPSSSAAPATARCSRSPTSPTRSSSNTCSGSRPACRGSRSSPGSPPTSRTSRRSGTGVGRRQRHRLRRDDQARARRGGRPRGRGGVGCGGRVRGRGARGAAPAALLGPCGDSAGAGAAGRVQSPPRGRPHALRRRTHRVVEPVAGRARDRRRARRAPERPRAASA